MVEGQRATDGQDPFTNIELVGVAPLGLDLQIGFDLKDRQVALGVGPHQPRPHVVTRTEADHDVLRVLDHVVVGHHIASGLVDDHARPEFGVLEARASWGCGRQRNCPGSAVAPGA